MSARRQLSFPLAGACLRRQRGQALVFGIFLLMAGLAGLYFLFNTGQVSAEKTRLVTTADAVAHGAGVMQARALNFDAYANRALVANEVLVAQMVSLSSWAQYAKTHADNLPWRFPECADPYGYGAASSSLTKPDDFCTSTFAATGGGAGVLMDFSVGSGVGAGLDGLGFFTMGVGFSATLGAGLGTGCGIGGASCCTGCGVIKVAMISRGTVGGITGRSRLCSSASSAAACSRTMAPSGIRRGPDVGRDIANANIYRFQAAKVFG